MTSTRWCPWRCEGGAGGWRAQAWASPHCFSSPASGRRRQPGALPSLVALCCSYAITSDCSYSAPPQPFFNFPSQFNRQTFSPKQTCSPPATRQPCCAPLAAWCIPIIANAASLLFYSVCNLFHTDMLSA